MTEDLGCSAHGYRHDVFLSYRRIDGEDLACHVAEALDARGVTAFWDQHCLGAGRFAARLERFDDRAHVFVPIVTPAFVTLPWDEDDFCCNELVRAIEQRKTVIPVMNQTAKPVCMAALQRLSEGDPRKGLLSMNICLVNSAHFSSEMDRLVSWIHAAQSGLSGDLEDERCFSNTFPDFEAVSPELWSDLRARIHSRIDDEIRKLLAELGPRVGPVAEASHPALNREDFSIYSGVAGLALALSSAADYLQRTESDVAQRLRVREDAGRALSCALELVAKASEVRASSFYCGAAGVYALASILGGSDDPSAAAAHTGAVLDMLGSALADPEAELLYGRAGYLYSLLVLKRHTAPAKRPEGLDAALGAIFDGIERDGATRAERLARMAPNSPLARSPLAFAYPSSDGDLVYFGAAHGLAGVLYPMLHLADRCLRPGTRERISGALDFLVEIQTEDGNFPAAFAPAGLAREIPSLVHWCHGAPGIIPTLCKAYEVFGNPRYLDAARRAGDCVWQRGLLRKGVGVCHGISGSALSLLTLYRATGNARYLYRALRFCEATWSEACLAGIAETKDAQRYCVGTPDFPYSLMEGKAGLLYAYVALQRPDQSSFPGYDGAT